MTASPLASVHATREVMDRHGLTTKKSLGQHFLIDDNVVGRILTLAQVGPDDVVVEVGPGIGTLSVALLPQVRALISVERDPDMGPVLAETCAGLADRFVLLSKDALQVTEGDLRFAAAPFAAMPTHLVANLPYAVAATIILDWFERFPFLEDATVMVQAEVADRIAAHPGVKDYGAYTVKLGLQAEPVGRFPVAPGCFFPPPRVDSAVVRLERRIPSFEGAPAPRELVWAAARCADAAFAQRRKNIRNSMNAFFGACGVTGAQVDAALAAAGIAPTVRGETLLVEDYLRLAFAFGPVLLETHTS